MKNQHQNLEKKIIQKEAKVGIIGLGYVGLPNAIYYASQGYQVCGFEINAVRVNALRRGSSYIEDISDEEVQQFIASHKVVDTFTYIAEQDVVIIDVPTPINEDRQPDLSYIKRAVDSILPYIHPGQLIILESTSYPGTTQDYVVSPLKELGFTIGEDIFVAFAPERVDPGNTMFEVRNTPKLVGGMTTKCTQLAQAVIGAQAIPVSSMEVAEMAKVYENTFRFININLANELRSICVAMGIDPYEVLDAANTKPFGFMKFTPSVKIGGHCIGVDPYYLKWQANQRNVEVPLIDAASLVERKSLNQLIQEAIILLSKRPVPLMKARVAILGVAYKKNVADTRMSAAVDVTKKLEEYQLKVDLYDPHAEKLMIDNEARTVISPTVQEVKDYDLVILLTDHDGINYGKISEENHFFIDTKGVLSPKL
ncbi:UDP-N-acetyl-D-glucosamine dehydrogenase [Enterococcus sp. AZ194]|uniref:nucleotide sugar dehydrogenase n=1 Tax=Enterococcus sp. AZ194 TaxID=2774629 RepID=UPI003F287D19